VRADEAKIDRFFFFFSIFFLFFLTFFLNFRVKKSGGELTSGARGSALERIVHDMTHWARPVAPAVVASFEARCAAFTVADLRAALLRLGVKAPASRLRKRDLVLDLVRAALARASVVDDPIVDADLLPAATPPAAAASVSVPAKLPPVLNLAAHVDADDDDATWSLGASQRNDVSEPANGADVDDVSDKLQALQLAWDGSLAADSRESLHLPLPTSQFHELLNKHVLNNNNTTTTGTVSSIAACAPMYSDSFAPHQPQDDDVSTSRGDAGDNDDEPTVPLQLTPPTPDALVLRRGATTLLTPYQGADVKCVSSGKLDGVVLPPSDPEQSGDDDDDDEPVFNDSPTVLLTDAARARLRDEQSRGTSSATALPAKPSITARIVVVADTASAGLPHDERDSLPVSRYFPALRAGEAAVSPPPKAPTDFQSGRRVLLLNSGAPAFAMSSVAQPFVAPRRAAVVFPTPADESRHSSTAAATAAPAPAATVWKARHPPATARAGNAPLAAAALGASTTTSSGSPDAPTVELRLSDRELLLRAASIEVPPATTQRALLFKSHSSNTVSSVSAKSDDMCKPIHVSHGTDSSDESGRLHTAADDDDDDDDEVAEEDSDEDGEWAQFASASSPPPATPLRRRARRRVRGSRGQRRRLPPSPLRRSLTADEAVAVAPAASAPKLGKLTTPALVAFSGDWRALRDSDGRLIWLHLPTGVVQFSAPDEKQQQQQQQQVQRSRRGGSFV
jgi:hypothetical protein